MLTKTIWCANDQTETPHEFGVENQDYIARCSTCARVVKFPGNTSKEELQKLIANHKSANQGHIPAPTEEAVSAALKELENKLV
jgi:hypothetical protein